jgi:nucleoside-diphosphate-sugar epimerase
MAKFVIGCGYLGERVARRWRAQGERVWAVTRSAAGAQRLERLGIEPVIADVLVPDTLTALPAAETVLYAVGYDRTSGKTMRDVYIEGLHNVLSRLPAAKRLLYVSSTGVYAQAHGEEVDETAVTEPRDESGQVVLEAERLLQRLRPEAVRLRFAGIYGPGRLLRRREALLAGEPFAGDPQQWLNLIHVEDGATAILAAEARAAAGEVYNISDGVPVTRRDFYEHLAALLGAPPPRFDSSPGVVAPRHDGVDRRIVNRKMRVELGVGLQFPSYREGLAASV